MSDNTGTLWPDGWHLDSRQLDALMTYTQRTGSTLEFKLTTKRGKRASFTVDPLPDAPPLLTPITDDDAVDFARAISEAGSVDELNKVGGELKSRDLGAHRSSLQAAWTARNNELKGTAG